MTSRCSYGCHTGQIQLQWPGRRRSHSDLDQHRRQRRQRHVGQEIQRKWKLELEGLEGNHTSDIFLILICFDLFWFVDLKSWKVMRFWWLMLRSPVDLFPSCVPIVGQSLLISAAIKVIWWLSPLLKNMRIGASLGINIPFRWSYLKKSISSSLIQSDQP